MSDMPEKSEAAKREEAILAFWNEQKTFEKSLKKESPEGEYVFYDGPPFATGTPHYGHIVASVIKDAMPRYKTMRGYHVPRTWGWDTHGLPIENIVEKELGFAHKKDIVAYGIEKFNERCRAQVIEYVDYWKTFIPRIGRWVDMDNAYSTMDASFMESVWWVFKQVYDKGLVYEDYRSMHICPRCETTLSQQEVAEGYKDVKDISVTAEFPLASDPKTSLLAWTTTPWTLPGNVALAVNSDIEYVTIEKKDEGVGESVRFIIAKNRLEFIFGGQEYTVVKTQKGSDLVGLSYEPPFDYYKKDTTLKNRENGWKVYAADFVTTDTGTGIVHIAPAFGEDDMALGKQENLPFIQHVAYDGTMKSEVTDFAGRPVKPRSDDDKVRLGTDINIIRYLQDHGTFFSKENITHSYPHCWRCDTPLLNYATTSWFISVMKLKDGLLKNAENIAWSPEHIKEGRFGKWLEGARDWSISRQRFWASAIPIWKDAAGNITVIGSVEELKARAKKSGNAYFLMR
ncbi:MAG: class I tRNA ligase family protein, partial [Minisyncoccota bacterium]